MLAVSVADGGMEVSVEGIASGVGEEQDARRKLALSKVEVRKEERQSPVRGRMRVAACLCMGGF